jgi:hypothetical protein
VSAAKAKKKGKSIGGFFANIASDAQDTVYGAPASVKLLVGSGGHDLAKVAGHLGAPKSTYAGRSKSEKSQFIPVAKQIGESYKKTYGPLFRGDVRKFADNLYNDGFYVAGDVITVASGGTAALAKAPVIGSKVATAGKALTLETGAGGTVQKALTSKPFRGNVQRGIHKAAGPIPKNTPVVGEYARAGKVIQRDLQRPMETNLRRAVPAQRAVSRLRGDEAVAAVLLRDLPLPQDLHRYIKSLEAKGTPEALGAVALLTKEKVQRLYHAPNKRVARAADELGKLSQENESLLGDMLSGQSKAQRPYLHSLLARGAKFVDDEEGGHTLLPPPGYGSVDDAIAGIKQDLAAAGRPEPIFVPETSEFQDVLSEITPRGGGSAQAGANLLRSAQAQNLGVLFTSGQRVLDPSVLVNKYLWNTKQAHYLDIHNEMMNHAQEIFDGRIPEGTEIVRKPARPFVTEVAGKDQTVGRSPQQISYTVKKKGDYEKFLQKHLPADNPFTTTDVADAAVGPKGGILVVPRELARSVKGEFTRMSRFAYLMNKGPVKVWRAAVLNLRPAWLVNNIVGNSFMYAISNMDEKGLRGLSEMFKKQYPQHAREFDKILDEKFARQRGATFIGTQRPTYSGRNLAVRTLSKAVGSLADVDKWWESGLRRAAVKAEILRNPALRKKIDGMRAETEDFWKAANQALDDPVLVQQIENRVNDALGNFTNMTNLEKNVMRTIFPFWAWYRAIVGVTLKLPFDQPIKVALLTKLAPIGIEANLEAAGLSKEDAPAFLRSYIHLGGKPGDGDRVRGLVTSGGNPYSTTLDMGRFVAALAMWQPGKLGKALPGANPFFQQAGETLYGSDLRGSPAAANKIGPFALPYGVYQDLPQVKLAEAFGKNVDPLSEPYQGTDAKPRLYDQDPQDLLLRFLGVPYARVSKTRAKQMVTP